MRWKVALLVAASFGVVGCESSRQEVARDGLPQDYERRARDFNRNERALTDFARERTGIGSIQLDNDSIRNLPAWGAWN